MEDAIHEEPATDAERSQSGQRTNLEKDLEAWNLPRRRTPDAGSPLESSSEREPGLEEDLGEVEEAPAA